MSDTFPPITIAPRADTNPRPVRADWPAWPVHGLVSDLLPTAERWHRAGHRLALATLVSVTGSSPRPVGSEMLVNERGEIAGYVSGGCVEAAVATEALHTIETGRPAWLDYGAGSPVLDVQLTCGGRIGIFLRALPDAGDFITAWRTARDARRDFSLAIDLGTGAWHPAHAAPQAANDVFRQIYPATSRLVVVGGDPISLALCQLAPCFGLDVLLLRPYGPAAPPPDARLVGYDTRPLKRALADRQADRATAVYTLTHDLGDDHAVLAWAMAGDAFAIGALGSRLKTKERIERLRADGFDDTAIERLRTPAGLSIGAQMPQEIALSILSEIVARRPRASQVAARDGA